MSLPPPVLRGSPKVLSVELVRVPLPKVEHGLDAGQLQELGVCHGVAVVDHVEHSLQVGTVEASQCYS